MVTPMVSALAGVLTIAALFPSGLAGHPTLASPAPRACVTGQPDVAVPAAPDFGPHVTILNPGMSVADINASLASVSGASEFDDQREAVLFLPGVYGCRDGTDAASTVNAEVGYYTTVSGLGATPDEVTINGALHADAVQANATAPWDAPQPGSLVNFWRSLSNVKVVPRQYPVGADALRAFPEGVADPGTMRWAVSQAAPLRRVDIEGDLSLFGAYGAAASGGFLADSRISGTVAPGSQQQFFTRDSSIGSAGGGVWNMVYSGVQGAPAQNFATGTHVSGPTTTLAATPVSVDPPFLSVEDGAYRVFVPNARAGAAGTDWSTDPSRGRSLPIDDFFIATPADSASTINAALGSGKNLILTPGVYRLDEPITVTRARTVVLGLGMATLSPTNGTSAIETADVAGVRIAGVLVDAGARTSQTLVKIGTGTMSSGDAGDPTALHDVFVRVGGVQPGSVDTAIQINSSQVILDDIWVWRADHGDGVGWRDNTANTGVEVNGRSVTALGLAVEHFQKNQVLWNGEDGTTVFYQSELPYDVPGPADWRDGDRAGYASYRVADTVTTHRAFGLGVYSYFNQGTPIVEESAIQAPTAPGVQFTDMVSVFLAGDGSIAHVINDAGGTAMADSRTQYLLSYPPAEPAVPDGGGGAPDVGDAVVPGAVAPIAPGTVAPGGAATVAPDGAGAGSDDGVTTESLTSSLAETGSTIGGGIVAVLILFLVGGTLVALRRRQERS